jgi:2-polyprenyl-3-methyl-5-hydroxy-6-metoxy-1,4-benzoquinol methylase
MRYELPAASDRLMWDIWLSMNQLPSLAVADELGVFAALGATPAAAGDAAQRLGLNRRATDVLLRMLAALGLLALRSGRYEPTESARIYLLPESPYYWGPLLRTLGVVPQQHAALLAALRATDDRSATVGVATAANPKAAGEQPSDDWERGQIDRPQAEIIAQIMHCHSLPAAVGVARSGSFEGVTRLLDVGGGSGCFSIAIAQQLPAVRCTVMELPAMCECASRYIAQGGVAERVDTAAVDMFRHAWPHGYDGVFFSNIFHDWDLDTNRALARRAYDALPPGGRIFVHEMLLADDGSGPLTTASFSLFMLLGTQGRQYAESELREILAAAGFVGVEARATHGYYSLVSGRKPR